MVALVAPLMGKKKAKRLDPKMRDCVAKMGLGRSKKCSELLKQLGNHAYENLKTSHIQKRSDNNLVNWYLKSCKQHMGVTKEFCPDVWMAFDAATIGQEDTMFGVCALNDKEAVWMVPQAAFL